MAKSLLHRVLGSMSKNAEAHTEEDFAQASRILSISPDRIGRDADPDKDDDDDEGNGKKGKDKKGKDADEEKEKELKEAKDALKTANDCIAAKDAEIARMKAGKDEDGNGLELSSVVLTEDEKIKDLFAVAGADAAYDVLKALRPHVAASGNKAVMDAYREQATKVQKMRSDTQATHEKLVGDAAYAGLIKARKPEQVVQGQQRMRQEEGADKTGKDAHTHEGAQDDVVVSYQKTLDARRTAALTAGSK